MNTRSWVAVVCMILLTLSMFWPSIQSARADQINLRNMPPSIVSTINIAELTTITPTGCPIVYANFDEELVDTHEPANVWIVNTLIIPNADLSEGVSLSLSISVSNAITFDAWSNQSGVLSAGRESQLLEVQNITSGYPNDNTQLRLWIGSNYSIDWPVFTTSIPTYTVSWNYTDYTNKTLPAAYANLGYLPQLFKSSKYVQAYDIYLGHSSSFQIFAEVAQYTPYAVIGMSAVMMILAITKPRRKSNTDYVQGLLTLLLFVPLFSLGIGQLVPSGDSLFLQDWLSSLALWTSLSFVVVAGCTVVTAIVLKSSSERLEPQG